MSDSDDEVDYMSAEFLASCVQAEDIRPGLVNSYAAKRKIEMEKQKKERDEEFRKKHKPMKEEQKERMEEGLKTAISSDNKGFAMLQKMGYKPGTSLGKRDTGIKEPVAVNVKMDRIGLGWQEMINEHRKKKIEQFKKERKEAIDPMEYRERKKNEMVEKITSKDLVTTKRVCYELDTKSGVEEPPEIWFWPDYVFKQDEDYEEYEEGEEIEEYEEEFEPVDQLQIITDYMRSTYLYCIWCGTTYEDEKDFLQNCPGSSRIDHDE